MPFALSLLSVAASLLLSLSVSAAQPITELVGEAWALQGEELLYREFHRFEYDADGQITTSRVEYRWPDGSVLGHKTLDFRPDLFVPAFRTEMYDGQWIEALEHNDGELLLIRKQGEGKSREEKRIARKGEMAGDAGFNTYVQENFDALLSGERLKFSFVAPNRLDSVKFKAERLEDSTLGTTPVVNFKISIASFLGFLVDPLLLSYDPKTKYLIEYQGITNIRDRNGDLFEARIRYPSLMRKLEVSE